MPHLRMGSCGLRRHQGSITQTVQEIVDIGNLIQYPLCNLLEPLPVDQQHMIRQGKRNRLPGEGLVADHDTGVGLVVLYGGPSGARTQDLPVMSGMLCAAELRAHICRQTR